jgi:UPF0176 protein
VEDFKFSSFYKFKEIARESLEEFSSQLYREATAHGILGLAIIGTEGCNFTISGPPNGVDDFKTFVVNLLGLNEVSFKDSYAKQQGFKRFKVDIREEIVTLGKPEVLPNGKNNHLSPDEWHQTISSENDVTVLDVRNYYESDLGHFKTAKTPHFKVFSEFSEYVKNCDIPKEKKVLMYCTGGIRCEKALIEMRSQGFENVYQLEGGILNYLEKYPEGHFEGECFVFDGRVAVDKNLQSSKKYSFCPHCGDPASLQITCEHCNAPAVICTRCNSVGAKRTCSKNCAYHHNLTLEAKSPSSS